MPAKKDIASSSADGQGRKGGRVGVSSGCPSSGKLIELLNEREFCERLFISNGVFV